MNRTYIKPSVKVHELNMGIAMLAGSDKNNIPTGGGGLGGNGSGGGAGWLTKRQGAIIIDEDEDEDEW